MRDIERDGGHMWLRQSVTFSVDGQSRTLEIGIPLRTGATPDEIEALLDEADAGMERIGRHLEARIARLGSMGAPAGRAATETFVEAPLPAPSAIPASVSATAVTSPVISSDATRPAPTSADAPRPARSIAERPALVPTSTQSTAPAARELDSVPVASPQDAQVTSPAAAGTPLALKDFLATVQAEQGLNPKQAMEKLGVKSLAGLNLREALEMLRRQALRDGTEPARVEERVSATPPSAPAPPADTAPQHYFDEEDDAADIILTEEDDELASGTAEDAAGPAADDEDEYEALDEVPDFGSPRAEPEQPAASAPAAPTATAPTPAPETNRAARILAHMRGMRGGGVASAQQRSAFKNIVVEELGEPKAKALIAGIWHITPEKLGPEQLDALNNWGKRETFAEDTELVLVAVKAEREHERAGAEHNEGSSSAPSRATPARPAPRRTSRAAPSGGA